MTRNIIGAMCAGLLFITPAFADLNDFADSDGDGIVDANDNCYEVANTPQRDTNGDGFGNMCDADVTNDEMINTQDLGEFALHFFEVGDLDTDLNGDGVTNPTDLGILKAQFFSAPGPNWEAVAPHCNCYFSSDCAGSTFCDWGGSFLDQDTCWWRLPKPQGQPGNGCDVDYDGPAGPICDGHCEPSAQGSSIGFENVSTVSQGVALWRDALVEPSIAGGGPVDAVAAAAAQALPFSHNNAAMTLGRHVADLLSMASDFGFYDYFCHFESYPDQPANFVNLAGDSCRIRSANLAVDALNAELQSAGSGAPYIAQIASHCSAAEWHALYAPRCKVGPDALECFTRVVEDLAVFLSTPRQAGVDAEQDLLDLLDARRAH